MPIVFWKRLRRTIVSLNCICDSPILYKRKRVKPADISPAIDHNYSHTRSEERRANRSIRNLQPVVHNVNRRLQRRHYFEKKKRNSLLRRQYFCPWIKRKKKTEDERTHRKPLALNAMRMRLVSIVSHGIRVDRVYRCT